VLHSISDESKKRREKTNDVFICEGNLIIEANLEKFDGLIECLLWEYKNTF
jgi:hypothetical protein